MILQFTKRLIKVARIEQNPSYVIDRNYIRIDRGRGIPVSWLLSYR